MEGIVSAALVLAVLAVVAVAAGAAAVWLYRLSRRVQPAAQAAPDPATEPADA